MIEVNARLEKNVDVVAVAVAAAFLIHSVRCAFLIFVFTIFFVSVLLFSIIVFFCIYIQIHLLARNNLFSHWCALNLFPLLTVRRWALSFSLSLTSLLLEAVTWRRFGTTHKYAFLDWISYIFGIIILN